MATYNLFMVLFGINTMMLLFLFIRECKRFWNDRKSEKKMFNIHKDYFKNIETR